ncbi:hypothetical protein [Halorussus ruber]|uniref:hypothetical protein n=1 Tax=Halorussus ruber TaxID=1126238 RepID=UPI0010927C46|nr:hypothetical protein [Halorussus ruber]
MMEPAILVNFLSLFLPAMIGVVGSYCLYKKRQNDRRSNLRAAFLAELEGTGLLDVWPETNPPAYDFLSVSVYESNTGNLGLLSDAEINALVRYYTRAKTIRGFIEYHSKIIAQTESSYNSDFNRGDRDTGLRGAIDKLELARQRALMTIEKERDDIQLPESGMKVSNLPDKIQQDKPLLLDFNFAEGDMNSEATITNEGEDFFQGELHLPGLARERDVLERDKSRYEKLFEFLWKRLFNLLHLN